jgi:hypothetical protein
MGAVLVASLAMTALRWGSETWAGATFLAVCGAMTLAVVGAVYRTGPGRAWWLGFALFGAGYLVLAFWPDRSWSLPTDAFLSSLVPRANIAPFTSCMGGPGFAYLQVGHSLFGLGAAVLGGLLSLVMFGASAAGSGAIVAGPRAEDPAPRRWGRTAVAGLVGLIAAPAVALAGLRWAPGPSAAVASFATWGCLALAVVGAIFGAKARRAAWLGAALFGFGYMNLVFAYPERTTWPRAAIDGFLRALRVNFTGIVPEAPPPSEGVDAANARIVKALEQPIIMSFPNSTPLDDVLKYIKANTESKELGLPSGIPIYVDPLALQEVEKTNQSPVTIDVEGVPLRTTLRLILNQLGLTYGIQGGLLLIVNEKDEPSPLSLARPPVDTDPFLVVGHCLLALLAAGLGSLLAPLVCKDRTGGSRPGLPGSPGVVE